MKNLTKMNGLLSFRGTKTVVRGNNDYEDSKLATISKKLDRRETIDFTEQKQESSVEIGAIPIATPNNERNFCEKDFLLPRMDRDILSETLHGSRLFNPTLEDIEKMKREKERMEDLLKNPVTPKKSFLKKKPSFLISRGPSHRRSKSTPDDTPILILDKNQKVDDKNFKRFESIDSYSEAKTKFKTRFSSPSVDVVKFKLGHNNKEKTKYLNYFNTLTRDKLHSIISEDTKWSTKLQNMPRVKVTPKMPTFESESEEEEVKPEAALPTTTNLMMRPSLVTNSLFSRIVSQTAAGRNQLNRMQKKYDFDKVTARWIPPREQGFSSESFIQTREGGAMACVSGKIWITGGYNYRPIVNLSYYDVKNNTFATVELKNYAEMDGRFNHSMVAFKDILIVFGGEVVSGTVFSSRMTSNTVKIIDTSI